MSKPKTAKSTKVQPARASKVPRVAGPAKAAAGGDPFEDGYAQLLARRVPVEAIEIGRAYVIQARRGGVGVAIRFDDDGVSRLGYRIHRKKWDDHSLFIEWDWSEGEPHGTAIPLRVIDPQPPTGDKKLLAWLRAREIEHRDEIRAAFKVVFGERITITEPVSGERGKVAVPKKSTKAKRTAKSTKKGGPWAPEFLALMGSLDEDIERPPQTPINFPAGWDHDRVQALIKHYDNHTEDEAAAELETVPTGATRMDVPTDLVPAVRGLIAEAAGVPKNTSPAPKVTKKGKSESLAFKRIKAALEEAIAHASGEPGVGRLRVVLTPEQRAAETPDEKALRERYEAAMPGAGRSVSPERTCGSCDPFVGVQRIKDGGRILTCTDETGKTTQVFLSRKDADAVAGWLKETDEEIRARLGITGKNTKKTKRAPRLQ